LLPLPFDAFLLTQHALYAISGRGPEDQGLGRSRLEVCISEKMNIWRASTGPRPGVCSKVKTFETGARHTGTKVFNIVEIEALEARLGC